MCGDGFESPRGDSLVQSQLFVWDGSCGLCANFVKTARCHFNVSGKAVPFQQVPLQVFGLSDGMCRDAAKWIEPDASNARGFKILSGHLAIGHFLLSGNLFSRLAARTIFALGPLARLVYSLVSKSRSRAGLGCALDAPQADGSCVLCSVFSLTPTQSPGFRLFRLFVVGVPLAILVLRIFGIDVGYA